MDRDRNRHDSGSGRDDQGKWDDWYGQFDPDRTRPIRRPPGGDAWPAGDESYEPGQPQGYGQGYQPSDSASYGGQSAPDYSPGYGESYGQADQPDYPAGYGGYDPPPPPPGPHYSGHAPAHGYQPPARDASRRERLSEEPLRRPAGRDVQRQEALPAPSPPWAHAERSTGSAAPPHGGSRRSVPSTLGPVSPRSRSGGGGRRVSPRRLIFGVLIVAIVLFCGVLGYYFVRLQQVGEGVFVRSGRPTQTVSLTERRNILLLGLDTRSEEDSRSDTMIVVTVDPTGKTAGMLSIPRDLWVAIPDFEGSQFGEHKINSSYQFGKNTGVENGGPLLAMHTIEHNFGIRIDNFVEVNFGGFLSIVDALGGVTIDVPRPLIDNEYPADYGFAFQRIYIPAGLQHMDGRTALQYVRSRHADSDLGRNQRQQAVLAAVKEQALQLDMIAKLDSVLKEITGTVKTNMSLEEVVAFGNLARDIPGDRIRTIAIGADMTTQTFIGGLDVLVPDWGKIRPMVRQFVSDPALLAEAAAIVVHNGTDVPGLATKAGEQLRGEGLNVVGVGNPPDGGGGRYPVTLIYDYTGGAKPATLAELRRVLNLGAGNVRPGDAATRPAGADILVMIGDDRAEQAR